MNVVNSRFLSVRVLLVEGPALKLLASAVPAGEHTAAEQRGCLSQVTMAISTSKSRKLGQNKARVGEKKPVKSLVERCASERVENYPYI